MASDSAQRDCSVHATIDCIVGRNGTAVCSGNCTLVQVADLLCTTGRTAAVIVDPLGAVSGAVTENDFLHAFAQGVPRERAVDVWLQGDSARLPKFVLPNFIMPSSASLTEAAEHMRTQTMGDFSSRHLIVSDDRSCLLGVLSALDLARALCSSSLQSEISHLIEGKTVAQVMKRKETIPSCPKSASLGEVVHKMISARQNCVLLVDDSAQHEVLDVVTPRDVVRAFRSRVPAKTNAWSWLHGAALLPRVVRADVSISEAAARMAANSVHHLLVVSPSAQKHAVGVFSSSDLVHCIVPPHEVSEISKL